MWNMLILCATLFVAAMVNADESEDREKKSYDFCYVNGQSYRNGQSFHLNYDPCTTYRCENGVAQLVQVECKDLNNRCHAHGSSWNEGCVDYTCEVVSNNYWKITPRSGCRDERGQCHPRDSRYTNDCTTYQCSGLPNGGWRTSLITTMCKDAYGKCHAPGGNQFAYVVNGRLYQNCSCRPYGGTIKYHCSSQTIG